MRLLLVISRKWEVVMRHADRLLRCTPVWCWPVLAVAAVTVLPGGPPALGQNAAAPASQREEQKGASAERPLAGRMVLTGMAQTEKDTPSRARLRELEERIASVHERVSPAVVLITRGTKPRWYVGTGVIVTADGYVVVTRIHRIKRKGEILAIYLPDGRRVEGTVEGFSGLWDLAVLKINDPGPWPHVEFGKSAEMKPGDLCIRVGYLPSDFPDIPGVRRQLHLGCIAASAAPVWLLARSRLHMHGGAFDLNGRLIGVRAGSSFLRSNTNTHASVELLKSVLDDLIAGRPLDHLPPVGPEEPADRPDEPRGRKVEPTPQEQIAAATARAKAATVRLARADIREDIVVVGWSGVIVTADGYVATCAHHSCLSGEDVLVCLSDGRAVAGKALGQAPLCDVGLMKITEPGPWPHVEMGDSTTIEPGDECLLLGYPAIRFHGKQTALLKIQMLLGVPRHKRPDGEVMIRQSRFVTLGDMPDPLRVTSFPTAGPLHLGDSGGGTFDMEGRLVGTHSSGLECRIELLKLLWDGLAAAKPVERLRSPGLEEVREPFTELLKTLPPMVVEVLGDGERRALGTIVRRDGWVVTVRSRLSGRLSCRLADGRRLSAKLHKTSAEHDLALLKVEADNLPNPDWADPGEPRVGTLIAAPMPGAAPHVGLVSHPIRTRRPEFAGLFDIDALLEREICGGPVIDRSGRIIGITVAWSNNDKPTSAVPARAIRELAEQLPGLEEKDTIESERKHQEDGVQAPPEKLGFE